MTRTFGGADDGDGQSPAEAFSVLANEVRVEIIMVLWGAEGRRSYADLRREVAHGNSGNFNYHLGKLVGQFVEKEGGTYALRPAGEAVARSVVAGILTDEPALPPGEVDERCANCGGRVELRFEGEAVAVRCTDCGDPDPADRRPGTYIRCEFPPGGLAGRSRREAVEAAQVVHEAERSMMRRGVCPVCHGPTRLSFDVCPDHQRADREPCPQCDTRFEAWSVYECEHCAFTKRSVTWFAALDHPAVIGFYNEHGLEEPLPLWTLTGEGAALVWEITGTVQETDPYRFLVRIPVAGDLLEVELDEDLEVVTLDRTSAVDGD